MSQDLFVIRRRDLLALGPACALMAGLTSSRATAAALDRWLGRGDESLSLAYWPDSAALPGFEGLGELTELPRPEESPEESPEVSKDPPRPEVGELVPAERLGAGDPRFARTGVRVRIHGLFGETTAAIRDLAPIAIDAHFRPYHDTAAYAWRFETGAVPGPCPPTAMTVPVTRQDGLSLTFTVGGSGEMRPATRFSLGGEVGVPKLRRGIYLALWRDAAARPLPSWRHRRLLSLPATDQDGESGAPRIGLASWLETDLAPDQAYLVMSFDYAA